MRTQKLSQLAFSLFLLTGSLSCVETPSAGREKTTTETVSTGETLSDQMMVIRMAEKLKGRYDDVMDYSEGFATVIKEGKYGLVDTAGKELIPPTLENMADFSNGYAVLQEGGAWRVIDVKGTVLTPPQSNWEFAAVAGPDLIMVHTKEGKYGYVTASGKTVVPFDYTGADFSFFKQGVAIMEKGEMKGLVDRQNNIVAPFEYSYINAFDDSRYTTVKKGGKWGIMRNDGVLVHPVTMPYSEAMSFSNGLSRVKKGTLNGYIDTTGKEVLPLQYADAMDFNQWGYAQITDYKQNWLINTKGEEIFRKNYSQIDQQGPDLFLVTDRETNTIAAVNKAGSALWPGSYTSVIPMGQNEFMVKGAGGEAQWFVDAAGTKLADYVPQ